MFFSSALSALQKHQEEEDEEEEDVFQHGKCSTLRRTVLLFSY